MMNTDVTSQDFAPDLEIYKELIFCPLDLPPAEAINIDDFVQWMADAESHKEDLRKFKRLAEKLGNEGLDRDYPWEVSWAISPATQHQANPWVADFDKRFPTLARHIKTFPFKRLPVVHFIAQKQNKEVFVHTDPDNMWGMRFYVQNQVGERLYFRKTKAKLKARPTTWVRNPVTQKLELNNWEAMLKTDRHYVSFDGPRSSFMIGGLRAAHGVEKFGEQFGAKITCLLFGEFDYPKLKDLFDRSIKRFDSQCLWY